MASPKKRTVEAARPKEGTLDLERTRGTTPAHEMAEMAVSTRKEVASPKVRTVEEAQPRREGGDGVSEE